MDSSSDVNEVSGKSFNYVVIGGGTAGCPLAATLSEKFSVLLVERGGSPYGNPLVFVSNDGVSNLRGRVLGGASAINGRFYSRASEDFVEKVAWDKEMVTNAYQWVESRVVFKPELTPWQYAADLDHIEGTKVGASVFDEQGRRHTSADLLEAGNPNNITVLLNATVKNVIFHRKGKHKTGDRNETIAGGIRFIKSNGNSSETYEAHLNQPENSCSRGDVILTAGALGSPQILLLSGIGPQQHLKNFNIELVVDLDAVGKGMKDNPGIALLADPKPKNFPPEPPKVVGIADDFKIIIEAGILPVSSNATVMPIAAKLAFPESEGKLELNSTDPRENPSVTFNYLANEKDLAECVKLSQLLERVVRFELIAFFLGIECKRKDELMSAEDELRKLCKKNVRTFYHYHGGCTMGSVVDKDYRVYGVKGLRVVDGSTFFESPGTNPMATLNYGLLSLQTDEYTSVAQHFVSKDGVSNFRGRVLGGGSAIKGGVFSRASEDYVGRVGWNTMVLDAYRWTGVTTLDERGRRNTSAEFLAAGNPNNITLLLSATVSSAIFHKKEAYLKPRKNSRITFNYLAKEKDMAECVKLRRQMERIVRSESIAYFLGIERRHESISTDDELRQLCKNVRSFYHYHGGCTVGSLVDKNYRVYGVKGLRVPAIAGHKSNGHFANAWKISRDHNSPRE
ncbi:protein HOTHEAD-like [Pyrus ussuriensis x Pyrus communis]|uniref:Protein HOTHEAD-like n=1 Tax=Pyrus ussuriensis x Pyrus communis TaxID=2448454 RepID=A0A5N5HMR3_9ROSA|nr:protein HOTHEAD-like [Pyrus ussuriensis x Pyrus communis]